MIHICANCDHCVPPEVQYKNITLAICQIGNMVTLINKRNTCEKFTPKIYQIVEQPKRRKE